MPKGDQASPAKFSSTSYFLVHHFHKQHLAVTDQQHAAMPCPRALHQCFASGIMLQYSTEHWLLNCTSIVAGGVKRMADLLSHLSCQSSLWSILRVHFDVLILSMHCRPAVGLLSRVVSKQLLQALH